MEVVVKQEQLSKALNKMSKIASSRTSLPILNNVLLRTNGSQLMLTSTNLEIGISENIGAKVEKIGEITVPARMISEFINSLPSGKITLKVTGEQLIVESEFTKSKISGVAPEDFPEMPTIDKSNDDVTNISMPASQFKEAVDQVLKTVGNDTSRPILTGVFWHTFEGRLYLAATDGYRLSEKKLFETEDEFSALIPATTLQEVLGALGDGSDEIEMYFDDAQAEFHIGDVTIVSRQIEGKFVDYRRLIPDSTEIEVILSKDDLKKAVKVASIFAKNSGQSVVVSTDSENSKLSVYSVASDLGENTSEVSAQITGGDGQISLNPAYIANGLSTMAGSEISYGFSGKLAPTVMKSTSHDDYIHIIMPLKS